MNQDNDAVRLRARRSWIASVAAALAIACAVTLAVAAWSFGEGLDGGWPESARWWSLTIAGSIVIVVGLCIAIVSASRSASAAAAVVLASSLVALGMGVGSWGKFASLANANAKREAATDRCIEDIKSMSIEAVTASRYLTSVMMVRPMAATSLYMIPELPAGVGGGRFAAKQREAATEAWDQLRADDRGVADICAASLAQFGEANQSSAIGTAGGVGYGAANVSGTPVDVIVE